MRSSWSSTGACSNMISILTKRRNSNTKTSTQREDGEMMKADSRMMHLIYKPRNKRNCQWTTSSWEAWNTFPLQPSEETNFVHILSLSQQKWLWTSISRDEREPVSVFSHQHSMPLSFSSAKTNTAVTSTHMMSDSLNTAEIYSSYTGSSSHWCTPYCTNAFRNYSILTNGFQKVPWSFHSSQWEQEKNMSQTEMAMSLLIASHWIKLHTVALIYLHGGKGNRETARGPSTRLNSYFNWRKWAYFQEGKGKGLRENVQLLIHSWGQWISKHRSENDF